MDSLGRRGPCRAWNWPVLKKPHGGFRWPKYARGYSVRSCKPAEELERNALTGTRPPALLREPCASPDGPSFYGARRAAQVCGTRLQENRALQAFGGIPSAAGAGHPGPSGSSSLSGAACSLPHAQSARPRVRPLCPSRPAPTRLRESEIDRRGFGQLSCCRRAGCGLSHRGPLPQRPAPVCLGAPSFIEGTAESTGFPCTASAKPPSPAQRSPTRICWSKVKSPFVSRTLGDTV